MTEQTHWWLQPMTPDSLRRLQSTVQSAHEKGLGLASVTMNRISIALKELEERMLKDQEKV